MTTFPSATHDTPAGPPLAPIAPPRPPKGGTGESRREPIDINLRITMTEEEANKAHDQYGCVVADLTGRAPGYVLSERVPEKQALHIANKYASADRPIGIFKLSRIITGKPIRSIAA